MLCDANLRCFAFLNGFMKLPTPPKAFLAHPTLSRPVACCEFMIMLAPIATGSSKGAPDVRGRGQGSQIPAEFPLARFGTRGTVFFLRIHIGGFIHPLTCRRSSHLPRSRPLLGLLQLPKRPHCKSGSGWQCCAPATAPCSPSLHLAACTSLRKGFPGSHIEAPRGLSPGVQVLSVTSDIQVAETSTCTRSIWVHDIQKGQLGRGDD